MKITISKSQWQEMGKKAGWMKKPLHEINLTEIFRGCANIPESGPEFERMKNDAVSKFLAEVPVLKQKLGENSSNEFGESLIGNYEDYCNVLSKQKDVDSFNKVLAKLTGEWAPKYNIWIG